tara:strand:+ start:858 stop:1025 length:168 start_codon:yes stop_codon:yes gene_type:complete
MKKNEVIILAGGFGKKLSKVLGPNRPKPMALIKVNKNLKFKLDKYLTKKIFFNLK